MNFLRKKSSLNSAWYNPKPESIGNIVEEFVTQDARHKSLIMRTKDGLFCIYLYERDESDFEAGMSDAIGWIGKTGPSFTDTIERAKELALEFLPGKSGSHLETGN